MNLTSKAIRHKADKGLDLTLGFMEPLCDCQAYKIRNILTAAVLPF